MKTERQSSSGYTALHIGCMNGKNTVSSCITSLETGTIASSCHHHSSSHIVRS